MDCKRIEYCLDHIARQVDGARKALRNGDSATVEQIMRGMVINIQTIRREQASIGLCPIPLDTV